MWKYEGMKPRKILIFSLVYYPHFVGGAEVTIKEVTDRVQLTDIEFDMVTLRVDSKLPKFERVGNINVYRLGWTGRFFNLSKYFFVIGAYLKACSLHRKHRYDATWSLLASYASFAAVFFKLTHKHVPFVFTLQDGDPIDYIKKRAAPLYPFFKMMFTKADRIQAISKYLALWAKDMNASCPIEVIPNAVDIKLFTKDLDTKHIEEVKNRFGKKDGDVFVITTSRLVIKNAVDDLINALTFLPKNFKLLILGQGNLETVLKQEALRLGLNYTDEPPINPGNRVHFLGHVPHEDMLRYLKASEVFVRPALSEGLGNSFLEAMAAGLPVIGTCVGGIPDFLKDGETGLFCEVKNPKSIALKIEKLTKDTESHDYIVKQAKDLVIKNYTWDKISTNMRDLFDTTMKQGANVTK